MNNCDTWKVMTRQASFIFLPDFQDLGGSNLSAIMMEEIRVLGTEKHLLSTWTSSSTM